MASPPQAQLLRLRGERRLRVLIGEPTVAASSRTVFLVHGAGGLVEQWRLVWPGLLEAGHRVVAFDALGHGGSPAPRPVAPMRRRRWSMRTALRDANSLYVFKAMRRQWLRLDMTALLGVTMPVQVLVGEADRLTPPDGARKLAALLPQANFASLTGCGHQILLEQPGAVVRAILAPQQA